MSSSKSPRPPSVSDHLNDEDFIASIVSLIQIENLIPPRKRACNPNRGFIHKRSFSDPLVYEPIMIKSAQDRTIRTLPLPLEATSLLPNCDDEAVCVSSSTQSNKKTRKSYVTFKSSFSEDSKSSMQSAQTSNSETSNPVGQGSITSASPDTSFASAQSDTSLDSDTTFSSCLNLRSSSTTCERSSDSSEPAVKTRIRHCDEQSTSGSTSPTDTSATASQSDVPTLDNISKILKVLNTFSSNPISFDSNFFSEYDDETDTSSKLSCVGNSSDSLKHTNTSSSTTLATGASDSERDTRICFADKLALFKDPIDFSPKSLTVEEPLTASHSEFDSDHGDNNFEQSSCKTPSKLPPTLVVSDHDISACDAYLPISDQATSVSRTNQGNAGNLEQTDRGTLEQTDQSTLEQTDQSTDLTISQSSDQDTSATEIDDTASPPKDEGESCRQTVHSTTESSPILTDQGTRCVETDHTTPTSNDLETPFCDSNRIKPQSSNENSVTWKTAPLFPELTGQDSSAVQTDHTMVASDPHSHSWKTTATTQSTTNTDAYVMETDHAASQYSDQGALARASYHAAIGSSGPERCYIHRTPPQSRNIDPPAGTFHHCVSVLTFQTACNTPLTSQITLNSSCKDNDSTFEPPLICHVTPVERPQRCVELSDDDIAAWKATHEVSTSPKPTCQIKGSLQNTRTSNISNELVLPGSEAVRICSRPCVQDVKIVQLTPKPSAQAENDVQTSQKPSDHGVAVIHTSPEQSDHRVRTSWTSPKPSDHVVRTSWTSPKPSDHVVITSWTSPKPSDRVVRTGWTSPNPIDHVVRTSWTSPKPSDRVVRTGWTSPNPIDHVVRTRWTSPKPSDHGVRTSWTSPKTSNHGVKTNWASPELRDQAADAIWISPKSNDSVSTTNWANLKPSDQIASIIRNSLNQSDHGVKTSWTSPKPSDQAVETLRSAPTVRDQGITVCRTSGLSDQAIAVCKTVRNVSESNDNAKSVRNTVHIPYKFSDPGTSGVKKVKVSRKSNKKVPGVHTFHALLKSNIRGIPVWKTACTVPKSSAAEVPVETIACQVPTDQVAHLRASGCNIVDQSFAGTQTVCKNESSLSAIQKDTKSSNQCIYFGSSACNISVPSSQAKPVEQTVLEPAELYDNTIGAQTSVRNIAVSSFHGTSPEKYFFLPSYQSDQGIGTEHSARSIAVSSCHAMSVEQIVRVPLKLSDQSIDVRKNYTPILGCSGIREARHTLVISDTSDEELSQSSGDVSVDRTYSLSKQFERRSYESSSENSDIILDAEPAPNRRRSSWSKQQNVPVNFRLNASCSQSSLETVESYHEAADTTPEVADHVPIARVPDQREITRAAKSVKTSRQAPRRSFTFIKQKRKRLVSSHSKSRSIGGSHTNVEAAPLMKRHSISSQIALFGLTPCDDVSCFAESSRTHSDYQVNSHSFRTATQSCFGNQIGTATNISETVLPASDNVDSSYSCDTLGGSTGAHSHTHSEHALSKRRLTSHEFGPNPDIVCSICKNNDHRKPSDYADIYDTALHRSSNSQIFYRPLQSIKNDLKKASQTAGVSQTAVVSQHCETFVTPTHGLICTHSGHRSPINTKQRASPVSGSPPFNISHYAHSGASTNDDPNPDADMGEGFNMCKNVHLKYPCKLENS